MPYQKYQGYAIVVRCECECDSMNTLISFYNSIKFIPLHFFQGLDSHGSIRAEDLSPGTKLIFFPLHFFQGLDSHGSIRAEDLSPDTKLILDEVTRFLNMEKLLPSYKFVVTNACLKAIRKLQKTGHLVSKPVIFKDYAAYGKFLKMFIPYFLIQFSRKLFFFEFNLMYCDLW